ncbi:hypothetical protein [Georgenia muralis]
MFLLTRALASGLATVLLAACSSAGPTETVPSPTSASAPAVAPTGDPIPQVFGRPQTLTADGGTADGVVQVSADPGDIPQGHEFTVDVGPAMGNVDTPYGGEYFGEPVLVEHDVDLTGPLTVSWDVSSLSDVQRAAMIIVGWDEAKEVWVPSGESVVLDGDRATTEVTQFSTKTFATFSDWVAETLNQNVGKVLGSRTDAPECSGSLPAWVTNTVRPDQDLGGVALLTCFEPDVDGLTLRAANNRPFGQILRHIDGGQQWAWTWPGRPEISAEGAVYSVAASVLDSDTRVFLPPTHEVAVGFTRPADLGAHYVAMEARADLLTFAVDMVAKIVGAQPIDGLDNPVQNAFFQLLFECVGSMANAHLDGTDAAGWAGAVLTTVKSCSEEILRPGSDLGARFEDASRSMIASGSGSAAVQANRWVQRVARSMNVVIAAEAASYAADLVAEGLVGPALVSFNANGIPQPLGQWTPTCQDPSVDSNLLYRNLALQDQFNGGAMSGWTEASAAAVAPLAGCDSGFRGALADMLPGDWGDRDAAEVVATAIRGLGESVTIQHPTWGEVTVSLTEDTDTEDGLTRYGVQVRDAGKILWERFEYSIGDYGWSLNDPATDATGNVFIVYNPGRLDGIIVLRPVSGGMDHLGTADAQDDYLKQFYGAAAVDTDGDGDLEVRVFDNDCDPDCAGGTVSETVYHWDGSGYSN